MAIPSRLAGPSCSPLPAWRRWGAIVFGRSSLLLATGVGIGSIAYSLSHRYAHSETFTPDARSRSPWNAHLRHHNLDARANFGFTTVFWDRVFGTIGERPLVAPEVERRHTRSPW